MKQNNIETKIENLLEPIISSLGYILYDVQYVKEGKNYYLCVTIDKDGGISIEDCEKVNNAINDPLDVADIIQDSYLLEVSSPGIERVLRKSWHFEKQIGNKICIKLFKPINKTKEFTGVLNEYNKENLKLEIDGKFINFETNDIALAKTVFEE